MPASRMLSLLLVGAIANTTLTTYALAATAAPAPAAQAPRPATPARDAFYWLSEINKASAVMVVETGIVPPALGKTIADSVASVIAEADQNRALRSGDYLQVEELLIRAGGPDVTRMHSGRSRQDIGATSRRLYQRDQILATVASLNALRATLLDFAAKHPDAIVPAYTQGVQAQPISFGHYILGYTQALERASDRLKETYGRVNLSPLGSAALGTSSFPVDRARLAVLLGFDAPMVNSLDANQLSPLDTGAEQAGVAASMALTVGAFASDIEAQYRMTTPWLTLTEGELTGTSSIMPQKRNPNSLNGVRVAASDVLGEATGYYFKAHNVPHGSPDYKGTEPQQALATAASMMDQLGAVVRELNFNEARALAEVNADYAATTELADMLQRDADVPFRIGHHFASELVTFGRARGLPPAGITYADARRIYTESARAFDIQNAVLPLDEATFRRSLTAENMVRASLGLGGPQPAEVARMLAVQRARLAADRTWLDGRQGDLTRAAAARDAAFQKLRTP